MRFRFEQAVRKSYLVGVHKSATQAISSFQLDLSLFDYMTLSVFIALCGFGVCMLMHHDECYGKVICFERVSEKSALSMLIDVS